MKFFTLEKRSLLSVHDPNSVKLLTRLRLKFSHLKEHKFHHLKDTVVSMCEFDNQTETTEHFFLHCLFFISETQRLFNSL